jgi:hypothetical protein
LGAKDCYYTNLRYIILLERFKACRHRAHRTAHFRYHCIVMSRLFLGCALLSSLAAVMLDQSTFAFEGPTALGAQRVLEDGYRTTCRNIAKSVSPASQVFYPGMSLSSFAQRGGEGRDSTIYHKFRVSRIARVQCRHFSLGQHQLSGICMLCGTRDVARRRPYRKYRHIRPSPSH